MAEKRGRQGGAAANLTGGGPSLVGPVGAMRARDVSKPTDADHEKAAKRVVIRRVPADVPFKTTPKKASPDPPRTP